VEDAARVAVAAVREVLPQMSHLRLIRFVLFSDQDLAVFRSALA
jgi:O-acetyl-ADP-ribose deacetylase (regulator of RNase III)